LSIIFLNKQKRDDNYIDIYWLFLQINENVMIILQINKNILYQLNGNWYNSTYYTLIVWNNWCKKLSQKISLKIFEKHN